MLKISKQGAILIGMVSELVGLIIFASIMGNYLEKQSPKGGLYLIVSIIGAFSLWVVHLLFVMKKMDGSEKES